jgi:hypothetical protein
MVMGHGKVGVYEMGLRTREQFLNGLRDSREVYYQGDFA